MRADPESDQPVEAGGVASGDGGSVLVVEPRRGADEGKRVGLAHVEREVGAQHHMVDTDNLDQMTQVERLRRPSCRRRAASCSGWADGRGFLARVSGRTFQV